MNQTKTASLDPLADAFVYACQSRMLASLLHDSFLSAGCWKRDDLRGGRCCVTTGVVCVGLPPRSTRPPAGPQKWLPAACSVACERATGGGRGPTKTARDAASEHGGRATPWCVGQGPAWISAPSAGAAAHSHATPVSQARLGPNVAPGESAATRASPQQTTEIMKMQIAFRRRWMRTGCFLAPMKCPGVDGGVCDAAARPARTPLCERATPSGVGKPVLLVGNGRRSQLPRSICRIIGHVAPIDSLRRRA
jgi:hypothetical protein